MSKLFLVCIVLAAFSASIKAREIPGCPLNVVNGQVFFNLCPFARPERIIDVSHKSGTYDFDMKVTLSTPHTTSCEQEGVVFSTITTKPDDTCSNLAIDYPSLSLIDESDENSGLRMTFPRNDNSQRLPYPKKLIVDLVCNSSMKIEDQADFEVTKIDESEGNEAIHISAQSYYGCPYFTLGQFFNFLSEHKYPFIAVFSILGLFFTFFGLKMFNVTIFLITAIGGTLVSGVLFFEFVKFGSQQWVLWVIFVACVTIGCVLGYLAIRYEKVGFFGLGAYLGVVGGLLLYNSVLIHFLHANQSVVLYVILTLCALIGGGLALVIWQNIIIIATSIIGAYLTIRSLSVLIGGFPNEIAVINGAEELSLVSYAYLVVVGLQAFVGIYYQFKAKAERGDTDEDEYKRV